MPSLLFILALLVSAGFQSEEPAEDQGWQSSHYNPPALPLTGYSDRLSGRLAADGTIDTGLVRLRFTQGTEGVPLNVTGLAYGKGPQLWAEFSAELGDVHMRAVCLGISENAGGDKRLIVSSQVRLSNPTDAPRKIVLNAQLLPSHESPVLAAVEFDASSRWARDGNLVVRDGRVVAGWVGPQPEVEVLESTDSPDVSVATLVWRLEVPAGGEKFVELKLVGAPAGESIDEDAWRVRFGRRNYAILEETLRWEGQSRGSIGQFRSKSQRLRKVLVNGVHVCRMLGAGSLTHLKEFSDNPYGQPATDAAVGAEMIGCLVEYGMAEYTREALQRLVDELPEQLAILDDERKVAYLHGLARAIRVSPDMVGAPALAQAIVELGDPDVPVEPWHDPRVVQQDLLFIVSFMNLPTDGLMTRLRWADVEEGTTAGHMQAARKAIADRQGTLAWTHMSDLFKAANDDGMGSMDGGELDARYSVGMLTIGRALLLDDHGDALNLFPGVSRDMVDVGVETDTTWLPSRFGMVKSRAYHVGPRLFGNWTILRETFPAATITVTVPDGLHVRGMKPGGEGGEASIVPGEERLVDLQMIPGTAQGIRFHVRVDQL